MAHIDRIRFCAAWQARTQAAHGVTLVALYGDQKPPAFVSLLDFVSEALSSEPVDHEKQGLGEWLDLYERTHLHATIIGLEGKQQRDGAILNLNLAERLSGLLGAQSVPRMDIDGLVQFLKDASWFPQIQFGGFAETDKNPYDPARAPFARAFEIQSNGLIVMIGWPIFSEGCLSPALLGIRKYCERFHVVHKWQVIPHHQDNDLFFVVGSLKYDRWMAATGGQKEAVQRALERVTSRLRCHFAHAPFLFPIAHKDIWLIEYFLTNLKEVGLCAPLTSLTAEQMRSAYRD